MKISVIGCGYLGAVHAAAMASIGHEVVGVDTDRERIASLARGEAPIYEPGLSRLLADGIAAGNLRFTTEMSSVGGSKVHFVAVGTPQLTESAGADMRYIDSAFASLCPHLAPGDVVVGKSTVPVGTAERLAPQIEAKGASLAWNPEFLREGFAVRDTIAPDRIVVGLSDSGNDTEGTADLLRNVYAPAIASGVPYLVMNFATAELVKGAANSFLATKISFINAMAEICEVSGADVTRLADAIGYDERIGRRFLGAGMGFGGGCLPKDIRAFATRAEELGVAHAVRFLHEVDGINMRRRERAVDLVLHALGDDPTDKRITILGAAFKPNSDDVRDSPALDAAVKLQALGAKVVVTDPKAIESAQITHTDLFFEPDLMTAIQGAECLLLATEWADYQDSLSPENAALYVSELNIVDGRNCLDADAWQKAGWNYWGLGRGQS